MRLWFALLALLLAGCANLPPHPGSAPSTAWPADPDSPLQRGIRPPDPHASGLHLMATGALAWQARLDLVRRARRSIDVQCFQIQHDSTGRLFLAELAAAAQRGVRVRLLLDDLHTAGHDDWLLGFARQPNVELRLFNPFPAARAGTGSRFAASLLDFGRVHRRMHNKLLVADGVMAVVGGRNIADDYFTRRDGDNFIDLDTLVVGAVLPTLSSLFDRYWNSRHAWPIQLIAHSERAATELADAFVAERDATLAAQPRAPVPTDRFGQRPAFEQIDAGTLRWRWALARAHADDPDLKIGGTQHADDEAPPVDGDGIRHQLVEAIRAARQEVHVVSPYVVATRRARDTVRLLRARGVHMTVITNSLAATDEPAVHGGYRRYREQLLDAGVRIWELAPLKASKLLRLTRLGDGVGRLHAKIVVIDGERSFFGSFNFDPRSATHNTELGLIVDSRELAREVLDLLGVLRDNATYRLDRDAAGGIVWMAREDDGTERAQPEPATTWWRRVLLELLAPLVPEDLL